jgi:surfactin family lipopeptide synthetase A
MQHDRYPRNNPPLLAALSKFEGEHCLPDLPSLSETKRNLLEKYLRGDLRQDAPAITRRVRESAPPLSLAQHKVWLRSQMTAGMPPLYNESITIYRRGPLDVPALKQSFKEMIRRHEAWRTTFDVVRAQPVQIIHPSSEAIQLRIFDLSGAAESNRETEALRLATEEATPAFDLKRGPLVRATLVTLADQDHRLFLTMHQTIVDGISVYDIIPSEIAALYEAFSNNKPSPLPDLPFQFADFAICQRSWLQGEVLANQISYWRKQLAGDLPVLQLPVDRARPSFQTYRGSIKPFTLARALTQAVRELSQREGVSLFATLMAAFTTLLYRYTGQEDIIIGTLAPTGRKRSEFQRLLGYFLNPVALRNNLSGNPTFRELLSRSQAVTLEALSHDDVPLEDLAQELRLRSHPSRHPLFQVVISLAPNVPDLPQGWDMTPMDVESGGARWDLYLELNDRPNGLIGRAQYNPDLFDMATIVKLIEDFQAMLETATSNPQQRLLELPLLPAPEKHQCLSQKDY